MFILKGTRTARIKTYADHDHPCSDCKDFDLRVKVYRDYYHLFFIPIWATGFKTVKIRCRKCDEPYRLESLQKQYERQTRTPFWLYTGALVVGLAIAGGIGVGLTNHFLNVSYISNPRAGDVYTVTRPNSFSEFYEVARVSGDSVITYSNNAQYIFPTSGLDSTDYFVKDKEVGFTKRELKEMLDKNVINDVSRHYGEESGFRRVR